MNAKTSGVKIAKEKITPMLAQQYLDTNLDHQRPVNQRHVNFLSSEMKHNWEDAGDTIKFDTEGQLFDGQHRLRAIISSGRTMTLHVARGCNPAAFAVTDTGKNRNLSDILCIQGEMYYSDLSAALRYAYYLSRAYPLECFNDRVSNVTLLAFLDRCGGLRKTLHMYSSGSMKERFSPPGITAAFHYMTAKLDEDLANETWPALITGEDINSEMPIFMLRKKLLNNQESLEKANRKTVFYWMIKTWNAIRQDHTSVSFRVVNDYTQTQVL